MWKRWRKEPKFRDKCVCALRDIIAIQSFFTGVSEILHAEGLYTPTGRRWVSPSDGFLIHLWCLVLLKFEVNSQKLGVQAPQNLEFE